MALFEVAEADLVGDDVVWVSAVEGVVVGAAPVLDGACTTQPVPEMLVDGPTDIVFTKSEGTLTSGHLFAHLTKKLELDEPHDSRAQFKAQLYAVHGKYGAEPTISGKSSLRVVTPVRLKELESNPGP